MGEVGRDTRGRAVTNLTTPGPATTRVRYCGGRPARGRVTHTPHALRAYAARTTARWAPRVSKKAPEAAAFSSVSASACITPAATAERWWTKKERVEVRAVPYTVPSVAPLRFTSLASCASRRTARRGAALPSNGCPSRYTASILTHTPTFPPLFGPVTVRPVRPEKILVLRTQIVVFIEKMHL